MYSCKLNMITFLNDVKPDKTKVFLIHRLFSHLFLFCFCLRLSIFTGKWTFRLKRACTKKCETIRVTNYRYIENMVVVSHRQDIHELKFENRNPAFIGTHLLHWSKYLHRLCSPPPPPPASIKQQQQHSTSLQIDYIRRRHVRWFV